MEKHGTPKETVADIVAQIRAAAYIQNADTPESVLRLANRIEAAWKRERDALMPQPDPDWKAICEKCVDGEIEPKECEYYGEPNGCNSPIYGEHPKAKGGGRRRSIEIPIEVVPTCSVARAQRRLELLKAQMSDMADRTESGEKCRFNPRAVIAEIDDTLATHPRNCDVFADALWDTISRAWQDWLLTPEFNKRKIGGLKEFCYWFLGPAKEGGAK